MVSNQLFRSAFSHSSIGMALVAIDGRWLDVNPALCELFGYTKEEFLKKTFQEMTHPEDHSVGVKITHDFVSGAMSSHVTEKRYIHKNGEVIWARLTISGIGKNGKVDMFVSQIQDITESKTSQQRLINASKMAALGEMASGIAHEINNPLTVIEGNASILKVALEKKGLDAPEVFERLERISATVQRICSIVDGMRNFSRRDEGAGEQKNCLKDVVSETLNLCREKLVNSGVNLSVELQGEYAIIGNRVELSQVLMNLLSNAHHALEDSPKKNIFIRSNSSNDMAYLVVKDNGIGVPEDLRDKIMKPFFTTKPLGKGTGLGLSLSKEMMERMGGSLELLDGEKGAEFRISIPLAKSQSANVA